MFPSDRHELLRRSRLYVLLNLRASREEFVALGQTLINAGVHVIQLRDKQASDCDLLACARLLRDMTRQTSTLCIINDRPDLAVLADADGVHLGQDDPGVSDTREILGRGRIVGVSTHQMPQVRKAVQDGADYIGCGPTFPSATKQFDRFAGLDFLQAVHPEAACPAFAIGGIDASNLPRVMETGFRRIAVGAAVVDAEDPAAQVRYLLELLDER